MRAIGTLSLAGCALVAFVGFGCDANRLAERTSLAEAGLLDTQPSALGGEFARTFRYYPQQQVYYSAFQDTYYWQHNGEWTSGTTLPATISLDPDSVVIVQLYTDRPYQYHSTVAQAHPAVTNEAVVANEPAVEDHTIQAPTIATVIEE